jgi:selenoprotein W-related protein
LGKPVLRIEYCVPCGYLPRATWQAQELLQTFAESLDHLELVPGTKGCYEVTLDDSVVFSKNSEQRFPETSELKESVLSLVG